jgi:hypothetical protein
MHEHRPDDGAIKWDMYVIHRHETHSALHTKLLKEQRKRQSKTKLGADGAAPPQKKRKPAPEANQSTPASCPPVPAESLSSSSAKMPAGVQSVVTLKPPVGARASKPVALEQQRSVVSEEQISENTALGDNLACELCNMVFDDLKGLKV